MDKEIKAIENCIEQAIADYDEVWYKKDSDGKPCISQEDINDGRLIHKLASKLKTIIRHLDIIKAEVEAEKVLKDLEIKIDNPCPKCRGKGVVKRICLRCGWDLNTQERINHFRRDKLRELFGLSNSYFRD